MQTQTDIWSHLCKCVCRPLEKNISLCAVAFVQFCTEPQICLCCFSANKKDVLHAPWHTFQLGFLSQSETCCGLSRLLVRGYFCGRCAVNAYVCVGGLLGLVEGQLVHKLQPSKQPYSKLMLWVKIHIPPGATSVLQVKMINLDAELAETVSFLQIPASDNLKKSNTKQIILSTKLLKL